MMNGDPETNLPADDEIVEDASSEVDTARTSVSHSSIPSTQEKAEAMQTAFGADRWNKAQQAGQVIKSTKYKSNRFYHPDFHASFSLKSCTVDQLYSAWKNGNPAQISPQEIVGKFGIAVYPSGHSLYGMRVLGMFVDGDGKEGGMRERKLAVANAVGYQDGGQKLVSAQRIKEQVDLFTAPSRAAAKQESKKKSTAISKKRNGDVEASGSGSAKKAKK